jgi:hypothetical protein
LNGFTLQQGSFRFFGLDRRDALDLRKWNAQQTWRFAWDERIEPFYCFASTAWGDQYAYRCSDKGHLEESVYFLEGTLLRAEPLAASFEQFAETELLSVAQRAYDAMTIDALARLGPIDPAHQWTYAPSIALGGEESVDNVVILRAEDAMVMAGDIATALRASPPGSWPRLVEPWTDAAGRQRLRVEFGPGGVDAL